MLLVLNHRSKLPQQRRPQFHQILKLIEDHHDPLSFASSRDRLRFIEELLQQGIEIWSSGAARLERKLSMAVIVNRQGGPDPERFEMLHDPVLGALGGTAKRVEIRRRQSVGEPSPRGDQHAIQVGDRNAGGLQATFHFQDQRGLAEAAGRLDQDVLAAAELPLQDQQIGLAVGNRVTGHDPAEAKGVGRRRFYAGWHYAVKYNSDTRTCVLGSGCGDASGGALQRSSARIVAGQQRAPVDAGIPGAEVGQGEAVAGGLRRRLAAANLAQVPVKELVAIDEAEHLAPGAKANASAEPLKGEPASGFASGAIVDLLVPAAERLRDLELD